MKIFELKNKTKEIITEAISMAFDVDFKDIALSTPPDISLGDFSLECFGLSKSLKISPMEIARLISEKIKTGEIIDRATPAGPYLNIKIKNQVLFQAAIEEIRGLGESFGNSTINNNQKIMVEYLSPNTNKPLHLGHLRNGALGMAISNILTATGAEVVKANLVNDRGVHICKSMLAWQRWGENSTPESMDMKGDKFVGHWYIKYAQELENDPTLEAEVLAMLEKWEANDPEIIELWKMMNSWVYAGFAETFKKLNFVFDTTYYESNTYRLGKDLIETGLKKGVFMREDNGSVVAYLPAGEFGCEKDGAQKKATLVRGNGTSVYITQDLGTAKFKFDDHGLTKSIYVVGSEQDYHFKVLFKLLEMLGFDWAKNCLHLSYGMVYLPEGKMKSREGIIVDADDLIDRMRELAFTEIKTRDQENKLAEDIISERSRVVADAAIKYYLLQFSPAQDIHFDPKASLAFEGNTGPYCQYTYARAKSILAKSGKGEIELGNADYSLLQEYEELTLVNKLLGFSDQIEKASYDLNPSKIATAIFEIAKIFNQYYQKITILNAGSPELVLSRLNLVAVAAITIKKGLSLLNIEVLEEM